jgi:cellulose synthase/poly-beta-1,6-N-acetylglucosamine synthase-like glycosyltransferase
MRVTRAGKGPGGAEVTAVIPCYNYGHFLPQAVNSVLDQSGVRTRVVIVDDCSTDDSLEVAKGLARADSRVTVIAHAVNEGHIKTYNDGLDQVRTEYLTPRAGCARSRHGSDGRASSGGPGLRPTG